MSYSDTDRLIYYPEDYDYSLYYQNEFVDYDEPLTPAPHSTQTKKLTGLPSISYLNERKCPIYIHHMRNDSSVYNNYNQKLTTLRKNIESPKVSSQNQNVPRFVLDKLEETYWATWKPKKENLPVKKKRPRKVPDPAFSDAKPVFRVHNKGSKKTSNRPHGDVEDNFAKHFKAKNFESSSTTASVAQDTSSFEVEVENASKSGKSTTTISVVNESSEDKKSYRRLTRPRKFGKLSQKDSVSQEIQTEAHCPVILEQKKDTSENQNLQIIFEREEEIHQVNMEMVDEKNIQHTNIENEKHSKEQIQQEQKNKQEDNNNNENNKKRPKNNKKSKKDGKKDRQETEENINKFIELKDSIEIAKEKQEKSASKEHYQQPKCIRLYRKSRSSAGYIKGGTYTLKSCLKKDSFPKGNFKLGAPGSPMFITTNSFSNKRRK